MAALNGLRPRVIAEGLGTFALVFAAAGAATVNETSGGLVTHVGCALTSGLTVMAVIYAIGDISGAHLNPAVTIGFWAAGRLDRKDVAPYAGAQIAGGLAAAWLLHALFPGAVRLGATLPAGALSQSFLLEIILTAMLMFVILSVSTGAKERGIIAGAAIGAVVALESLFAGPVSGASMNPARSLGPALATGRVDGLWIYLTAPVLGALLAVPSCRWTRPKACCG